MSHCATHLSALGEIRAGDTLFFTDFWNPSVQHFYAHTRINRIPASFIGWFHGASFVDGDTISFLLPGDVALAIETAWAKCYDQVFVASRFFGRNFPRQEILVHVPDPFDTRDFIGKRNVSREKAYDVVVPFRMEPDKINLDDLLTALTALPHRRFLIESPVRVPKDVAAALSVFGNATLKVGVPNEEHIDDLASARVVFSTAVQEGWGYAVMKAITVGCVPVLSNTAVYPELYPATFLYSSVDEAVPMIERFVREYPARTYCPPSYSYEHLTVRGGRAAYAAP
jgi:hypothetical protein